MTRRMVIIITFSAPMEKNRFKNAGVGAQGHNDEVRKIPGICSVFPGGPPVTKLNDDFSNKIEKKPEVQPSNHMPAYPCISGNASRKSCNPVRREEIIDNTIGLEQSGAACFPDP